MTYALDNEVDEHLSEYSLEDDKVIDPEALLLKRLRFQLLQTVELLEASVELSSAPLSATISNNSCIKHGISSKHDRTSRH